MAYIKISRTKKGELRARIQVHGKDPATSEHKLFVKHIQDEEGLTESKFRKKINLIAAEMEKQVEKDYEDRIEHIHTSVLTFSQLADEWISTINANLSHVYFMRATDVTNNFNEYLKKIGLDRRPISDIRVRDIQLYLNSFSKGYIKGGRELAKLKKPLPEKVSFRELARLKILPRQISYGMNHEDKSISLETAKAICNMYDLKFDTYFNDVTQRVAYSPETIKGYRRVLRTLFNEAVRYEWITKNPVCATKVGTSSGNVTLRPVEEKEVFSIKESQEFIQALNALPEEMMYRKVPVKIMLLAGLRTAEVCGLTWADIDLEKGVINVNRNRMYSKVKGVYEKEPKTKTSKRSVPIPTALIDDLKEYKKWFEIADINFSRKLDKYYIASNIYREPISPPSLRQWLEKFEDKHGFKRISNHGLRHTYCSILLAKGVPIQTVSKYMGHSDSTVTLQVYSHFIPDTQEKVLNALDDIT